MPKAARYRLTWVGEHQIYALREAHNNEQPLPVTPGSVEWFSWLSSIPSFTFSGQHGQLTVRQEARGGAGTYWYAYRRHGDKMLKRYLGRTADLTPAHLEEVALQLTAPSVSAPKQELSAEGPSQEHGPAQGRYLRPSPKDEGASLSAASPPSEPSPALQTANLTGTAPHALHHAHHDVHDLLLATKLHLPHPRAQLVPRSHLVERLQQGVAGALTLVSAPAGFGKTTLLAQWRAATRAPVAWLSLEPEDNEPTRFLTYFIAALQTLDPHLGARALALLGLPQPEEPATVLTLLANDLIGWQGEDIVLVLDDYHVITAAPIHRALTYLVEHLPPKMLIILATRSDPPLPLARLRARGQLTELRAAELRFGAAEAGAFLAEVMGLHLSQEDVTTLQARTEGWIAGLQAYILFFQGDLARSVALAEQASHHLAETPAYVQEAARVIAAHRLLLSGDVRSVGERRMAWLPSALSIQNDMSAMEMFVQPASIQLQARQFRLQGRLRQAAATYEQLAQMQVGPEGTLALVHPGYCFGLGELCYEWNDLDTAERLLEQGREALHGPLTLAGDANAQGYATLACLQQARNKPASALTLMEEFVRLAQTRQFVPAQLAAAEAVRARLALMQGHLAAAVRWAEASGLSAEDDPSYPREREYLTFVRVRIAQGRRELAGPFLAEALRLLERLQADAEAKARLDSLMEILVLRALALFAVEAHRRHALTALERALLLGEQEGYIRLFVDEGEPMVAMLRQAYARGIAPDYVVTLLSALGEQTGAAPSRAFPLVEPLTERELAVLRLLVRGLSNAEIARELIITVGTVKRHVNSIYGKLGVQSRTQAVARAQALHFL
jgi:ATP/maltotriose-dependent transcriptional regulator MalT